MLRLARIKDEFISKTRSALRDWFGAFGTNVALLAIGILTGIVAARTLGPSGRGEFAEILFWGNFVAQIGAFGLPSSVMVEAACNGSSRRFKSTVLILSLVYSAISVAGFGLAVAIGFTTSSIFNTAFVATFVPTYIIGLSLLSIDAGSQRFGILNTMRMVPQSIYAIGMVALASTGLANPASYAWALVAGSALVPLVRVAAAGREMFGRPQLATARRLVLGGIQFHLTTVIGIVREASDRLLILAVLDQTALGLYAVALTIAGSAIQNVAGATTTILLPKIVATADENVRARQLATATSASLFVTFIMNGIIALLSPFLIPILFGEDFASAIPVAIALCLAQISRSGAEILSSGLRGLDDWKAMPLTTSIALVTFFPIGLVAAQTYGPTGVAASLAVSNLVALSFVLQRGMARTGLPFEAFIVPPKWMFSPNSIRHALRRVS